MFERIFRQELYDMVWSSPLSKLAKQLNVSAADLTQACVQQAIPRPPNGYWSMKEFGKAPPRPPLPDFSEPASAPQILGSETDIQEQRFSPEITALVARVMRLPKIEVLTSLRAPHPIVSATKAGFDLALSFRNYNALPLVRPRQTTDRVCPFPIIVMKESIERSLRILNCLVKTVELLKGKIPTEAPDSHRPSPHNLETRATLTLAGIPMAIRMREIYKQINAPKANGSFRSGCEYVPTGFLTLEDGSGYSPKVYFKESAVNKFEDHMNDLLEKLAKIAGMLQITRRREATERGIREREIQVQRQREAEAEQARLELKRQRDEEASRVQSLLREAESWHRSQNLRVYIRAIEDAVRSGNLVPEDAAKFPEFIKWANKQADRLDPLTNSPPSILDEN